MANLLLKEGHLFLTTKQKLHENDEEKKKKNKEDNQADKKSEKLLFFTVICIRCTFIFSMCSYKTYISNH